MLEFAKSLNTNLNLSDKDFRDLFCKCLNFTRKQSDKIIKHIRHPISKTREFIKNTSLKVDPLDVKIKQPEDYYVDEKGESPFSKNSLKNMMKNL